MIDLWTNQVISSFFAIFVELGKWYVSTAKFIQLTVYIPTPSTFQLILRCMLPLNNRVMTIFNRGYQVLRKRVNYSLIIDVIVLY
jgi:hypothetical protein